MRNLRKRALVALGLALSLVALVATPAHAYTQLGSTVSDSLTGGSGWAKAFSDGGSTPYGAGQISVTKTLKNDGTDHYSCVETWVDYETSVHRSPDLAVTCSATPWGDFTTGAYDLYWPDADGPPLANRVPIISLLNPQGLQSPWIKGINICRVDARAGGFVRVKGGNCTSGSGADVNSYSGMNYTDIFNENSVNEPQVLTGTHVDVLWPGPDKMVGKDFLTSLDGRYHASFQDDGNFVVYNRLGGCACWSTATNGIANGGNLVNWSDRLILHKSDGNFAWVVDPAGTGWYLVMQSDGNLVYRNGGGSVAWASGTNGC